MATSAHDSQFTNGIQPRDDYLRVLFPRSWELRAIGRTDQELFMAARICGRIWDAREQAREAAGGAGPRRVEVLVNGPKGLGEIKAIVCLDCPWVAWGDRTPHPGACIDAGAQQPDILPQAGAMRVALRAKRRKEPWGRYFNLLYPPQLVRDFGTWRRRSTGDRTAWRLWDQRQRLRDANPHLGDAYAAGAHIGTVLDAVPWVAYAACLTCTWLEPSGVSMEQPNWRALAAAVARVHELESRRGSET